MSTKSQSTLIIADAAALIEFARLDTLSSLHKTASRVLIPDIVTLDACINPELRDWLAAATASGSVEIASTETGALLSLARQADPAVSAANAGRRAVIDWIAEQLEEIETPAIVIVEDEGISRALARQGLGAEAEIVTAMAFLDRRSLSSR
jgi:hypothetical protein